MNPAQENGKLGDFDEILEVDGKGKDEERGSTAAAQPKNSTAHNPNLPLIPLGKTDETQAAGKEKQEQVGDGLGESPVISPNRATDRQGDAPKEEEDQLINQPPSKKEKGFQLKELTQPNTPTNFKIDFMLQFVFCSRSPFRDAVYWLIELSVWCLLLNYLFAIETEDVSISRKYDPDVMMKGVKRTTLVSSDPRDQFGLLISGVRAPLHHFETHFNNREFSWVCLLYLLKHLLYAGESVFLLVKKDQNNSGPSKRSGSPFDLIAPLSNAAMWLLWFIWANSFSGHEINAGIYYRFGKDLIDFKLGSETLTRAEHTAQMAALDSYREENVRWPNLWIVPMLTFVALLAAGFVGVVRRRSSAFHGVSLATLVIPLQLLLLHLFFSGNLILSNGDDVPTLMDIESKRVFDNFEVRWVFCIFYLFSYLNPLVGAACIFKAVVDIRHKLILTGVKFAAFGLIWVFGFVWILLIDKLMYEQFVKVKSSIIGIHCIILALGLVAAFCSVYDKWFVEGWKRYLDKQLNRTEEYRKSQLYN